jgi:hypothetical protein
VTIPNISAFRNDCNLTEVRLRNPNDPRAGSTSMRIVLLLLPVVLIVLTLAACGGKGGGGY